MSSLNATLAPAVSNATSEKTTDDTRCVICMENIDADQRVTLRCMHAFHGQCICNHLVHDGRCPLCRDSPYGSFDANDRVWYASDDEDDEAPRVSLLEAFKAGTLASKTDKRTGKIMTTYRKWKAEATTTRKALKALSAKLGPLEDALEDKIVAFATKERAKFDEKHKSLIESLDSTVKHLKKCRTHQSNAKVRIAKKHGYARRPRHS